MSFTSKFTERFDIDTSDEFFRESSGSPVRAKSLVYSSTDLNTSNDSNLSTRPLSMPSLATSKPIPIPSKKSRYVLDDADISLSPSEKVHDSLSNIFKQFVSTISRKRNSSVTSSISRAVSTEY